MSKELVHKVTLSTGKEILLRDFKIKHEELATQAVGTKAGKSEYTFGVMVQKELLKILLYQIDGKPVNAVSLEDLDAIFTYVEYKQVMKIVAKLMGGEEEIASPKYEVVNMTSGAE